MGLTSAKEMAIGSATAMGTWDVGVGVGFDVVIGIFVGVDFDVVLGLIFVTFQRETGGVASPASVGLAAPKEWA